MTFREEFTSSTDYPSWRTCLYKQMTSYDEFIIAIIISHNESIITTNILP